MQQITEDKTGGEQLEIQRIHDIRRDMPLAIQTI